jgi:hypothetical protein
MVEENLGRERIHGEQMTALEHVIRFASETIIPSTLTKVLQLGSLTTR